MITLRQVNHVGVRAVDRAKAEAFYVGILGLEAHPTKRNWLQTKNREFCVHLMPGSEASSANDNADLARHFALETEDLEGVVDGLLAAGYTPFQCDITGKDRKDLVDSSDLTFGIGTIFVWDPDRNLVEFVDRRRGLLKEVLSQTS